jgi:hypothetical protein
MLAEGVLDLDATNSLNAKSIRKVRVGLVEFAPLAAQTTDGLASGALS